MNSRSIAEQDFVIVYHEYAQGGTLAAAEIQGVDRTLGVLRGVADRPGRPSPPPPPGGGLAPPPPLPSPPPSPRRLASSASIKTRGDGAVV
jgi:hypothetical protein